MLAIRDLTEEEYEMIKLSLASLYQVVQINELNLRRIGQLPMANANKAQMIKIKALMLQFRSRSIVKG